MIPPDKLYKLFSANVARIDNAINRVELHLRQAVAKADRKSLKALLPLYGLLIGTSAETQLVKLIHEPEAFKEEQRSTILGERTHLKRWHRLLECSIRNHNKLNDKTVISTETVGATDYFIFKELNDVLDNELKVVIELRNKLAHGQWEYPFMGEHDYQQISGEMKKLLDKENLLTLKFKRSIIKNLLFMVRDVAVSRTASRRDFDAQHRRMKQAMRNLKTRSYEKYKNVLVDKRKKGRIKELANYKATMQ